MKPTAKEILAKHAAYFEALIERREAYSPDSVVVAAATLALIEVTPEVEKDS
jgi:hypothetical protein